MCKKNDKEILYLVGKMYFYGINYEKNKNLGLTLLNKSASQGYKEATKLLNTIAQQNNKISDDANTLEDNHTTSESNPGLPDSDNNKLN